MIYRIKNKSAAVLIAVAVALMAAVCAAMLLSSMPTAHAEDVSTAVAQLTSGEETLYFDDVRSAVDAAQAKGSGVVKLLDDCAVETSLTVNADKSVTLDLNGRVLSLSADASGAVINAKGILNIEDGAPDTPNTVTSSVDGGAVTITGGAITGGKNDYGLGGGISIAETATVNFNGGTVFGNTAMNGGGICVRGTLNMTDGASIAHNKVGYGGMGGGVFLFGESARFNMSGGSVELNDAGSNENGIGGGVAMQGGTFEFVGGSINNNKSYQFGGISVDEGAELVLSGKVCDNIATNGGVYGGGIYIYSDCSVSLSGEPIVRGNKTGSTEGNMRLASAVSIVGTLSKNAEIRLDLSGAMMVATGFFEHNPNDNPTDFFKSDNSKLNCVYQKDGGVYIDKHNYTELKVDIAATCEDAGSQSTHCANCDDKTDITEITALGHAYGAADYSWSDGNCTATRVCARDGSHKEIETVAAEVSSSVAPTCTTDGYDMLTASFANTEFAEQSKRVDKKQLGHAYGEWQVVKHATLEEFGEQKRVCSRDGAHVETRQTPKRVPQLVEPDKDGGELDEVIVLAPNGFAHDVQLVVIEIGTNDYSDYEAIAESVNGKIGLVYDVTLKSDGVSVQPDGEITVKLRIPEELRGKQFKLFHLHESEATDVEYTVDGKYAVVTTDKLSEFIFIGDKPKSAAAPDEASAVWLVFIVVLAVIILCEVGYIVYTKTRGNKDTEAGK